MIPTKDEAAYHDVHDDVLTGFHPWMETGSSAHVCYVNRVPFIAIRAITDTPTHSGAENFDINCEKSSEIAKDIVIQLLKEMKIDHEVQA